MYSVVSCAIVHGIESLLVRAETDLSSGLPVFEMVGFLGAEVKEARERVRTAMGNCGYHLPVKRITVNLSPANIRKSGSGFDLPVAISILAAMDVIRKHDLSDIVMMGELGLNGQIYPVNGVLPMVLAACDCNKKICVVPKDNYEEAALVKEMKIIAVSNLQEVVNYINTDIEPQPPTCVNQGDQSQLVESDFKYINGQRVLRRACEVAASGLHNLLMIGPPGSGKTMAARCIPSILPPMNRDEQMELSKIYSVCGKFKERSRLIEERPFRSPHHTVSQVGLVGGGRPIRPGEVSLAHGGVLFLDELTEFRRDALESLRQPLEDRQVSIVRANGSFLYPAQFMLVAAMNPCKCGYFPDMSRCQCTFAQLERYFYKISQPMLDRIDLCVEAPRLGYEEIRGTGTNESSESIRKRVLVALEIQKKRFAGTDIFYNSRIPAKDIPVYCDLGEKEEKYMQKIYQKNSLTARTFHKLLRVARTIADLDGSERIKTKHLTECLCYRCIDKKEWEKNL